MRIRISDETRQRAIAMEAAGMRQADVAKALGHARSALFHYRDAKNRERYNERRRLGRLVIGGVDQVPSPEALRKVLADRNYRRSLPDRDLTAVLCGDPPVGLSALEKRRARKPYSIAIHDEA
jgi:transposase-like protein